MEMLSERVVFTQQFPDYSQDYSIENVSTLPHNDTSDVYPDQTCSGISAGTGEDLIHFRMVFMSVIYIIVFFLGMVGNGLAAFIMVRYKQFRSITENYLFHLALADLLLVSTFPFIVTQTITGWIFGQFLCKVINSLYKISFYCCSLLLGCIGFDRYTSIVLAIQKYKKRKAKSVHITCAFVWFLCLLLSLPELHFYDLTTKDNKSRCYFNNPDWWLITRFIYHIIGFFIPLAVMCYCYSMIIKTLCGSQQFEKQRATKVALLVTGVFFICWIPYNISIFLETLTTFGILNHDCSLLSAIVVTESIGMLHCCLNPLLYVFTGVRFRNHLFQIFVDARCLSKESKEKLMKGKHQGSSSDSENGTSVTIF